MSQAGGILNITNSHNAIINWGSFSIGVNELTRFIQPSALSPVLNRVIGQDPSAILGALQSNGRVFLINPNGIVFGSGAQINVAGLVASTLNISNDDFLNNRMRFTDGALAGNVVNQGNITGGNVYLIGNAVANNGLITSPNGEVVLAAGNSVELVNPGTPNLRVEVVASANEARNLGTISAEAGRIGIYAGLIKQGGTISADSAVAEGGRIMLKSTKSTVLEAGSVTTARGTSGGEIIALSGMKDGKTEVAGKLDASAIASGSPGAGGFIDTSAAKVKIADSAVITAAGSGGGKAGTWLIDPADFYISNAYGGNMSATFLSSALDAYGGTNVDILSTSSSTGTTGTIFVNDAVTWSTDSTLRLIAVGNVDVNSAITNTGAGAVKLYAGWTEAFDGSSNPIVGTTAAPARNINLNAPISTLGDIHLVAHGNIVQGAPGSLTANGLQASSMSGFVNLANPSATNTVNTVSGRAIGQFAFKNTGNLTVGTVGGASGITAYGGFPDLDVTVNVGVTGGALTVANPIVAVGMGGSGGAAGGNANISLTASNGINVNSNLTATAGHGGSAFYGGTPGNGGLATISLTSTGVGSSVNINSSAGSVNANGGGGGDGFSSGIDGAPGGGGTINVTSAGGILVEASVLANGGHGGSGSNASGGLAGNGAVNMSANGGDLTIGAYGGVAAYGGIGGYANLFGDGGRGGDASVNLSASGGLTVTGTAGSTATAGGAATIDIVASGAIVINGSVDADGGDADYYSGGGNGGNASVKLTSTGSSITISGSAEVEARGGDVNSFYSSGNGGQGIIEITSAGNTSVSGFSSVVQAYGGDGGEGGIGGAAAVVISAGGGIFVSDSVVESYGGSAGSFGQGGAASVGLFASGPIQIEGGEGSNIRADGGYGENGGNAAINVISGGSILLSGSGMDARRGDGEFEGVASIVVAAAGNLTLQNEAYLDSEGIVGLGGANILLDMGYAYDETGSQVDASGSLSVINNSFLGGSGIASITTGGNVLVETDGWIVGYPDVMLNVGGEVFLNSGGRIEAGLPTTIHLTFPMLTSGGFTVNGIPGLVFDGSTGFFAGGSGAVLGTNLMVTYGGGAVAELNVPTKTLIVAMGESIQPPDAEKEKDIFEDENQLKKKKDAPVCR